MQGVQLASHQTTAAHAWTQTSPSTTNDNIRFRGEERLGYGKMTGGGISLNSNGEEKIISLVFLPFFVPNKFS